MIHQTQCRCCRQVYEITWDDTDLQDLTNNFDDDMEDSDFENDDPAYCPFCGSHCDYDE
jgi:hypothetical protein